MPITGRRGPKTRRNLERQTSFPIELSNGASNAALAAMGLPEEGEVNHGPSRPNVLYSRKDSNRNRSNRSRHR